MVNDETLQIKKKKKKKRRQSELGELDSSQINTKKGKKLKDGVKSEMGKVRNVKKKKKKKKSQKNSTIIFDPPEPVMDPEDDVPAVLSDQELFGSQSPSPIKHAAPQHSPPPLTKHSPAENNDKEPSNTLSEDSESDEEVKSPVIKAKLSPVKKVAKKTKIVNKRFNAKESPKKKLRVAPESDDSEAEEEVAPLPSPKKKLKVAPESDDSEAEEEVAPLPSPKKKLRVAPESDDSESEAEEEVAPLPSTKKKLRVSPESDDSGAEEEDEVAPLPVKEEVEATPLSDPLISQHEQDQSDLVLLGQVRDKFPLTLVKDVNWNDLFVFNMTPQEMAARYEVLLSNIPREKNNGTLAREAMEAFCNSKIREVPSTKQDPLAKAGGRSKSKLKKKLNAFTLFRSTFDQKKVPSDVIKDRWEHLDVTEKKRLKKEARVLNNVHGIQRGERKGPRVVSGYLIFSKELMNRGMKMTDVGATWRTLTDPEKKEYQELAVATNRDRQLSHNEQAQSQ